MLDITKDIAFIAISFNDKYKNVIEIAIKPAIEDNALIPVMADGTTQGSADIYKDIADKIYNAKICIADLSKKYDNQNNLIGRDNIFYEVGLAHAINKPMILLCSNEEEDIPYNIKRLRAISYNPDNLLELKAKLFKEIQKIQTDETPVFFNQVKFLTQETENRLKYLEQKAKKITIEVDPPIADIFFNDQLLGQSPQDIYVNSNVKRNTISIASPAYFEEHKVLTTEDVEKDRITFNLQKLSQQDKHALLTDARIVGWLRDRRIDSNNPVLMRAIAQYLNRLSKMQETETEKHKLKNEAIEEIEELVKIAPGWYLARNQLGFILRDKNKLQVAMKHYKITIALNPDSYIGYFNLACIYAQTKNFDKIFDLLKAFYNEKVLLSYSYSTTP